MKVHHTPGQVLLPRKVEQHQSDLIVKLKKERKRKKKKKKKTSWVDKEARVERVYLRGIGKRVVNMIKYIG